MQWLTRFVGACWRWLWAEITDVGSEAHYGPAVADPGATEAALAIADADPVDWWDIATAYQQEYPDLAENARAAMVVLLGAGQVMHQEAARLRRDGGAV